MPTAAAGPTGHGVGYAPQSETKSMCAAWIAPSASNAIVHVAVLVARLARGEQVLAAVLDPLQRRADLRRREHQAHLVALHHDLLAEAAAGVARSTTRMRCSGMPSRREQNSRTSCGACVAA